MSHYGFNIGLGGRTECDDNWVKNPIYSAPAIKGLKVYSIDMYIETSPFR